ncbi:hypothetical protein KP003_02890 [Geomonas nitrogeniifigens]|uniref:hypothetical protein n=1 Tax=Geomonas diazotrophica TaxID=2843197 RepID=UPI001C2B98CE|nr:hypothetical protein [Geomonas nitrogeniifigens]QXE87371.1 hypothetical protein KP003_02890 [Geomonas nitrogeniifigens]
MIPNLIHGAVYAVHLRAPSVSGGKDWVGAVTQNGEIHTYWGKSGQIIQHAAKPGDMTALQKIITQKKTGKDQYTQVDEYSPQHGWQSQRTQQSPKGSAQPATSAAPLVDWPTSAPETAIQWDF